MFSRIKNNDIYSPASLANTFGQVIKNVLNDLAKNHDRLTIKSVKEMIGILKRAITQIEDHPEHIKQFTLSMGFEVLINLTSRSEIIAELRRLKDDFIDNNHQFNALTKMVYQNHLLKNEESKQLLLDTHNEISKIKMYLSKEPSIDNLKYVNHEIKKIINKLENNTHSLEKLAGLTFNDSAAPDDNCLYRAYRFAVNTLFYSADTSPIRHASEDCPVIRHASEGYPVTRHASEGWHPGK